MNTLKITSKKKAPGLKAKTVLINAGPTHERIDPVRFIGNYSSGKMGLALAKEAVSRGAELILILGPVNYKPSIDNVSIIDVVSASEMATETVKYFTRADITILAAAVADYTPVSRSDKKIKRHKDNLTIELKPTVDIAATLGKLKKSNQILVGFALETDNENKNAAAKLKKKNLDLIVLNSLRDKGAGFGHETNLVSIIDRNNNIDKFELKSKEEVASDIFDKIEDISI